LIAGLALRAGVYLRNAPIWHDELFIVFNLLHKNFGELLGPLTFMQAAPPLFLWAERTLVLILGDSTYALRLLPFLASCAALVLFWRITIVTLEPSSTRWAVLFFAGSDMLLRHTYETKPYALDLFWSTLLIWLYQRSGNWPLAPRFVTFALLAPIVLGSSYAGPFLYTGLLVALLSRTIRACWLGRAAYAACTLTVVGTAIILVLGPIRAQRSADLVSYWQHIGHYPPWSRWWFVPWWTINSTLEIGRYCYKPAGQVFALLAAIGGFRLCRRHGRELVSTMLLPVIISLCGSLAGLCPYGGSRLYIYAAPAYFLMLASSIPPVLAWLATKSQLARLGGRLLLVLPALMGAYHAIGPLTRPDCQEPADYVLRCRHQNDLVAANNCESLYYFRCLGSRFIPLNPWPVAWPHIPQPRAAHDRLWLIVRGETIRARRATAQNLLGTRWRAFGECEFRSFAVYSCTPVEWLARDIAPPI
jgi:hypothetical protein